jgi:segregation and condensation protein A
MSTNFFLKLDRFEGPLDLLLHLIKVHEIDIFDIDVFLLTSQYLEHLRLMDFQDLGDASEFMEMAATLIEIKSKMLLPRQTIMGEDGSLIEDDPRRPLQERLLEYEMMKRASESLADRPLLGVQIHISKEWQRLEKVYEGVEGPLTGDCATLCILYEQMLKDLAERKPNKVEVKTHRVSVDEIIFEVEKLLETVSFALFQGLYQKFNSRYEMVVYILAVLELAKQGKVRIFQREMKGPIWFHRSDCDVSLIPGEELAPREERQGAVAEVG